MLMCACISVGYLDQVKLRRHSPTNPQLEEPLVRPSQEVTEREGNGSSSFPPSHSSCALSHLGVDLSWL